MKERLLLQGRKISIDDIQLIINLITDNPEWHRTKLSKELSKIWNWRRANGDLKDMSCRLLLLKLEKKDILSFPLPVYRLTTIFAIKLSNPRLT